MNLAMITVIGQCRRTGQRTDPALYQKLLAMTYGFTALVNGIISGGAAVDFENLWSWRGDHQLAYILVMIHNGMAILFMAGLLHPSQYAAGV